jgi:hypothetical protein
MKTRFVLMMIVAVAVALSGVAFAADTAAAAPSKPAASAAPAAAPAAPAAKAPEGVKATVKGAVASKTVNRKGKDIKMYEVTVASAMGADGKSIDNLKGKALHLGPKPKIEEIAKFDGKTAEISGMLVEGKKAGVKMLRVETIK